MGGGEGRLAHFLVANDVFQHDDGVIHHKAHGQGQRHEGKVVEAEIHAVHDRKGGNDRHGQGQTGDDGGRQIAQEKKDDQHHKKDRQHEGELHFGHGFADGLGTIIKDVHGDRGRHLPLQFGQEGADGVHHFHGIGPGLALHGQGDAGRAVIAPGQLLVLLHAVDDLPDVAQAHGRAVPVGHHHIPEGAGILQLARSLDGLRPPRPVQRTGGQLAVGGHDGLGNLVNAEAARGQRVRVKLHAHGVFLLAVDDHLRHALDHGEALADEGVGVFVEIVERQGRRTHAQIEDGQVGGIDLAEAGVIGHVGGQAATGQTDGGLHVQGRGVDVAIKGELDGDARAARGIDRGDGVDAGNGEEFLFQRRGHRSGHGFRVRAGQVGGHLNGGKVHIGQLVHGQVDVARRAEEQQAQHDQHRGHGSADEKGGNIHL